MQEEPSVLTDIEGRPLPVARRLVRSPETRFSRGRRKCFVNLDREHLHPKIRNIDTGEGGCVDRPDECRPIEKW